MAPKTTTSSSRKDTSVRRQPLKRSRGLSQFYSHKSQSFNCMQDLVSNPFARSAVALAKRCSSWRQQNSVASVEEEMSDCDSHQQPCPLERQSWDLSDSNSSSSSISSSSSPQLSPANSCPELMLQQTDASFLGVDAPIDQEQHSCLAAAEHLLLSGLGLKAPAAPSWCQPGADSLCLALQATSLAAPLGLAGFSMPSGFSLMAATLVGVDDAY